MATITAVTMPKWGIEMTEGAIIAWSVSVGQAVERGAPLLDVETAKIVNAVDAPGDGVLRRVLAEAGETLPVGALLGVIAAGSTSEEDISRFVDHFTAAVVSFEPVEPVERVEPIVDRMSDSEGRASPIARRLAERFGVDLAQIQGTGRNGRISSEDVEAFVARRELPATGSANTLTPQADSANAPVLVPMSARRLTIARRLVEAKQQIPHYRLEIDLDAGALLARRQQFLDRSERVSLNDLIVRATALALAQHPLINSQLDGDKLLQFPHADVAVAIATDSGLITPIVRCADLKTVEQIAVESRELADRARRTRLTREEITGGTFTVSNLGMYGIARFDAIINPPQVAILAVGALGDRVVPAGSGFAAAKALTLTLSADHRVVDGAVAAAFLATLNGLLLAAASL